MIHLLLAAGEPTTAEVPRFIFPLGAAAVFTFLGFVTWSFRDVAYRHSHKFDATRTDETGVDEFGHTKI
ncbi:MULTISPECIES: hypothetical protein [unclassified Curtobacterium]|uniref:hypothetical protein n=1 Tax=unclassified Curtobacterium TaxID=257496 RepID=UPI000DAA2AED|nr:MULTISPECIES: hypothetical protein [unclassified Curtobacterium]PZE24027.1 hypothetical protein DEI86_13390 [Curtobacterium sp. MCBD17_028]PZE73614.1 hypothetical protein DEI82_13440 [Curtobacterium sp. MCBD17_019]PZF56854.1 hypothetical protein DEI92_13795 [Curtobacterium sp. MCBD17_034]PZF60628.1 hypothetical protein DEI81_12520 [Curtobacterium sp. MCBD17_013]PZM33810.1 hypothetical protein DEI90_11180 [Curtobacterium sp. MCBD17_031]